MPDTIPAPLVSSTGPFTISIAAGTRATGGVVTWGTPVVLTAIVDAMPETYEEDLENVKPMSMRGANNVVINEDWTLEITEIIYQDVAPKLQPLFFASLYFQVVIVAGGPTPAVTTATYSGIRAGGGRTIVNGKSTFMMRLKRVETGNANPLVVTA